MFITKAKKPHRMEDGSYEVYDYYRLTKSYRDADGRTRKRSVLCLGRLEGYDKRRREELAAMLTEMIERGQSVMSDDKQLYEDAMSFYVKYRGSKYALENDPLLRHERERKEAERRRSLITVRLDSLTQHEARTVGAENLCASTLRMLKIREFLYMQGWTRKQADLALMQIIARSVYPYSELKTVRWLRENSALAEMFKLQGEKDITKDKLYQSAHRLWDVHERMEDWLHGRVCDMFNLDEKILLFDITNAYFEGRMDDSDICKFGRSKEKRNDCKIVVLAAVVNTQGLLVRTRIYEGNRQDVTTLKEVIGSLADGTTSPDARKIVVMDAGFYSKPNVDWLVENHYDYITVLPAGSARFTATSPNIVRHEDCRHNEIRLRAGKVSIEGQDVNALLVDSDGKALKEESMYDRACQRFEEGLEAIKAGILKPHGTKKRDAVNKRLGKLEQQYGAIRKGYTVTFTYEGRGKSEKAVSMTWEKNTGKQDEARKGHGKYVLITSLDEKDEVNVWKFYNVIRTVEETFHTLKTDLDIRPVYHKTDDGIKAHLNLAVLAYWVVSVTKYRLRLKGYENIRWDEIMRVANTQVMVTAKVQAENGDTVSVRQCTEAEQKLSEIYALLGINPHPLGRVKSVVHPNAGQKNPPPD